MSQIFSADAIALTASVVLNAGVDTLILTTRPMPVPFDTAKAKISVALNVACGPASNIVRVRVVRNLNAEALGLGNWAVVPPVPSAQWTVSYFATDSIPDGRSVSYSVFVLMFGDNGSVENAGIDATLISG